MSQEYFNQTDKATLRENGIEANQGLNNYSSIEEKAEYGNANEIRNKEEKLSSHSKHSSHQNYNDFENDSGSAYSYSTGSNLINLSQPSSAVNIHISGSSAGSNNSKKDSKKRKDQSSGYYLHFEPSTIERDLNSDKIFNSGNRSKKNPKHRSQQQQTQKRPQQQAQQTNQQQPRQQTQQTNQQQPRQQQIRQQNEPQQIPQYQQRQIQPQLTQQPRNTKRQPNLIDDSPDSYQISDKYADRDVNINNNFNDDSNEYTYEYISESNSEYQRNLPQVLLQMKRQQQQQPPPSPLQQQRQPNRQQPQERSPSSNFDDDSEYTYIYDYPSSELGSQFNDNNRFNSKGKNNRELPNDYNNNNRYESPKAFNYNNNNNNNRNISSTYDDSEYTYTYESVSGLNSDNQNQRPYQQQRQQQQQQPRAIDAELIPHNVTNRGAPLMPIQMQLRVPGAPQIEPESTNDYTYTYDEPTTDEKLLIETAKNRDNPISTPNQSANNYSISNIPQVEIAPIETKKKNTNKSPKTSKSKKGKKMISPRKIQIQEKINKLQKNLDKLENATDDDEETGDINDNTKINTLKDKLANLTGWRNSPRNGQIQSFDTNTYTYTFEYESEVFPQKKPPTDLRLASPIGIVSIEADRKPPSIVERNFLLNDENPQKINLSISPAVQSEASNQGDARKKKAEQLQEIFELKRRLQQLQQEVNDENFSYEEPPQSESETNKDDKNDNDDEDEQPHANKVRVKKRVRVAKQVKLAGGLKKRQEDAKNKKSPSSATKMVRVQKRVKIEKNKSHHHHHSHHLTDDSKQSQSLGESPQKNYSEDEEFVTRDVVLDEDENEETSANDGRRSQSEEAYEESTCLQLLDESSSPASSSTTAALLPFASPKSPLRLLDEGSDEEDDGEGCDSLRVRIDEVESVPDVDVFCVAILDRTGEARKTRTAPRGKAKIFDQQLTFPLRGGEDDSEPCRLLLFVKRQDLIKNDRLLGKAKIDLDLKSLRNGSELDKKVQLTSDAGIPTQSTLHLIISLHNITSPPQPSTQPVVERGFDINRDDDSNNNRQTDNRQDDIVTIENEEPEDDDIDNDNDQDNDHDYDDQTGDADQELRPSNMELTSDMKNKLKIHRNNFISPRTNDESGIFILEPPSQSPLDADQEPAPSSSFITDLVRSRDSTDTGHSASKSSKSSSTKQPQKNVNFTKSDKITYNLENDVRMDKRTVTRVVHERDFDLEDVDEAMNEYESENSNSSSKKKKKSGEAKKKRRIIQKIEPANVAVAGGNDDDDDEESKEPIQIEINFGSSSYQDYTTLESYGDDDGVYSTE